MAGETTLQSVAAKAACDALVGVINDGSGSNGTIQWTTGADAEITTTNLEDPAFGPATSDVPSVASLLGTPLLSEAASAPGTITKAKWRDKAEELCWEGTVGTEASNSVTLTDNTLGVGDRIEISSGTFSVS